MAARRVLATTRATLTGAALMLAGALQQVLAAEPGPKVPAGRNPGGFPVVLIGPGLDYTQQHIASRLARDGEGEIIGYDFIDDDRRPFDTPGETAAAELVLGEGQATTLVAVRVSLSDLSAAAKAIRYAADAPGKVVLMTEPVSDAGRLALLDAAARRFPNKLFIAPVTPAAPPRETAPTAGLLLVAIDKQATAMADVAVPPAAPDRPAPADADALSHTAARIAALAGRLVAVEPELTPEALKVRILGLAEPQPGEPRRPPVITNPRRHFWLE